MRSSSGSRAPPLVARLARLAGHVLVAALCLELAARLDDRVAYGAPFWGRYDAETLRKSDDEGLPRNVPGARFEKWRINALGFRGELGETSGPAERRRVACVGTSESFGLYEREGGEWPARLRRMLRERHQDAEVLNASVLNLNRGNRERYIDKYVVPLRPDVIVLYLNVLSDATYRTPAPAGEAPKASPPAASPSPGPVASRVLPKLKRAARRLVPDALWRRFRTWSMARAVGRQQSAALRGRPPLDVLPAESVSRFEAHLTELISSLRDRGIAPVLATYPTLGTVTNRDRYQLELLHERVWHVELSDLGMIDAAARLNDAVRRVARALRVPLAEADAALPKDDAYFADYVHYTDAGAERVAETVLAALERGGLLGSGAGRILTNSEPNGRAP